MKQTQGSTQALELNATDMLELETESPFHFLYSVWKPSHFPAPLERHYGKVSYRTFRLSAGVPIGVRMTPLGGRRCGIRAKVFSQQPLLAATRSEITKRLRQAYGLDFPIGEFYRAVAADIDLMEGPVARLYGMRPSCPESLFEILVISMTLQNTTVKRSQQMLAALLEAFGDRVQFDGQELYVFCDVSRLAKSSEQELRERCRLGYRAKYLQPVAEGFAHGVVDEDRVRSLPELEAKAELMKLKGIGPYSAHVALSSAMQNTNLINLDVWNRKIFSGFLFGHPNAPAEEVICGAEARWNGYKALAALYIVEDLYREAPASPLTDPTSPELSAQEQPQ